MALLRQLSHGAVVRPATRCLVGRAPSCHWRLDDADVSREHAVLFYERGEWKVRDLSSRNGTHVDGHRVESVAVVRADSVLRFGSDRNTWHMVDTAAPLARALGVASGRVVIARDLALGLCLPDNRGCEAFVRCHDGQWIVERDGDVARVADGDVLQLGDEPWRLQLTLGEDSALAPTSALAATPASLLFRVSRDEEHVELALLKDDEQHQFPHRSHSYLLLLLARARLADERETQLSLAEHGWLETKKLADMLRTTSERINVLIFRARKQFQELDPELAQRLIERRPVLGQLRIGLGSLDVVPL